MTEMELYKIVNETHEKLDKLIEQQFELIKQQKALAEKVEKLNEILDENTKNKAPN